MKTRVVFFSTAEISIPCLEFLYKEPSIDFVSIVTQPERMKGRGQKISLNPIAKWAKDHQIPFIAAEKMDSQVFENLEQMRPDLVFVMAFGHILKKHFLDLPPLGMWNFHTSLLPKYRGASPIQTCLINGDHETGVTLMLMEEKMDAGPWLAQKKCVIDPQDTTLTLTEKLSKQSAILLRDSLPTLLSKQYILIPQEEAAISFCKKFSKNDGLLDFNQPATSLERYVRAFQPWPSAYFFYHEERYIIRQAHVEPSLQETPGKFIVNADRTRLFITTKLDRLAVDVIQKSGGKTIPIAAFLRGNKTFGSDK